MTEVRLKHGGGSFHWQAPGKWQGGQPLRALTRLPSGTALDGSADIYRGPGDIGATICLSTGGHIRHGRCGGQKMSGQTGWLR